MEDCFSSSLFHFIRVPSVLPQASRTIIARTYTWNEIFSRSSRANSREPTRKRCFHFRFSCYYLLMRDLNAAMEVLIAEPKTVVDAILESIPLVCVFTVYPEGYVDFSKNPAASGTDGKQILNLIDRNRGNGARLHGIASLDRERDGYVVCGFVFPRNYLLFKSRVLSKIINDIFFHVNSFYIQSLLLNWC